MFLPILAHAGCPGQNQGSCKMVVCVLNVSMRLLVFACIVNMHFAWVCLLIHLYARLCRMSTLVHRFNTLSDIELSDVRYIFG